FIFLAMVGLVVGIVAVVLTMPPSRAATAALYVSSVAGLLWAGAPWLFPVGMIAFGGLVVIGAVAWRAGAWRAWRFAALVAFSCSPWVLGYLALAGFWAAPDETQFALFGLGGLTWLVVGTSVIMPRRRAASEPLGTREA